MTHLIDRRGAIGMAIGTAAFAAGVGAMAEPASAQKSGTRLPIVLFCDLRVDPAREQEMLTHFHEKFKPAATHHKGYIALRMLKLRQQIQGFKLPDGINYRFELTYESEELRQLWIASDVHKALWPGIENTLLDKDFHVSLFDEI